MARVKGRPFRVSVRVQAAGTLSLVTIVAVLALVAWALLQVNAVLAVAVGFAFIVGLQVVAARRWGMLAVRPLERDTHPQLFDLVGRISAAADLPAPRIVVHEVAYANSWVGGLTTRRTKLHLTRRLLDLLDERQLAAVVAHELAHVRQRDSALMSLVGTPVAAMADGAAFYFHRYADMRHVWTNRMAFAPYVAARPDTPSAKDIKDQVDENAAFLLGVWGLAWLLLLPLGVLFLVVGSLCGVITAVFSRARELEADAGGALLTGNPAALASALISLSDVRGETIPRLDLREAASLDVFHIVPLARQRPFLHTHPPLERRLAQLGTIEASLQRGGRAQAR